MVCPMKINIKKIFGDISNKTLIYILGGIGVLLILVSSFSAGGDEPQEENAPEADYCSELEEKLEGILPQIANVGRVDVMVTAKNYGEIVLAKNEKNTEEQIVILNQKGGGEDIKIIEEIYPEIKGVIVVADGGKSDKVRNDLTEAIMALLGVEAHKIKIFERKYN